MTCGRRTPRCARFVRRQRRHRRGTPSERRTPPVVPGSSDGSGGTGAARPASGAPSVVSGSSDGNGGTGAARFPPRRPARRTIAVEVTLRRRPVLSCPVLSCPVLSCRG